ncbi:MAG: hypothetical protein HY217_03365 [Candidatus Rokubacteria bacterium]|nr:hypothetical protein [Candidatus Rokubacteria bacterium]
MTGPAVDYERALVEAAVLAGLGGRPEERAFQAERDGVYEIPDPEAREAAFAALHGAWFERLRLDRRLPKALAERPEIAGRCARCIVARVVAARDESADLLVAPPALPTLLVRVRAATLGVPARWERLLRHELLHVADMLDPAFGYAPRLPSSPEGPAHDRRLAERYRVLWDAYVDGRLARAGRVPAEVREVRLGDFARAFSELGDRVPGGFEAFFGAERCTHADLVAFAQGAGADRPTVLVAAPHP